MFSSGEVTEINTNLQPGSFGERWHLKWSSGVIHSCGLAHEAITDVFSTRRSIPGNHTFSRRSCLIWVIPWCPSCAMSMIGWVKAWGMTMRVPQSKISRLVVVVTSVRILYRLRSGSLFCCALGRFLKGLCPNFQWPVRWCSAGVCRLVALRCEYLRSWQSWVPRVVRWSWRAVPRVFLLDWDLARMVVDDATCSQLG